MKMKLNSPTQIAAATAGSRGTRRSFPGATDQCHSTPQTSSNDMTTITPYQPATAQYSYATRADNLNSWPVADPQSARQLFFARHGRDAELPLRRPATAKAFRKALVAAEMAGWECF